MTMKGGKREGDWRASEEMKMCMRVGCAIKKGKVARSNTRQGG